MTNESIDTNAFHHLDGTPVDTNRILHSTTAALASPLRRIAAAVAEFRRSLKVAQAEMELLNLPDYLLDDIGISRHQLNGRVYRQSPVRGYEE